MNLRILSKARCVRVLLCSLLVGGLLSAGCARGPRALAEAWSGAGGAVNVATRKMTDFVGAAPGKVESAAVAEGTVTANSGASAGADEPELQVASAEEMESSTRLSPGKIFSVFSRQHPHSNPPKDPFAAELAADAASKAETQATADGQAAAEDEDKAVNPFAEFAAHEEAPEASTGSGEEAAKFEAGFDTQLEQLRALMEQQTAVDRQLHEPLESEYTRLEVYKLTAEAEAELEQENLEQAYKIAVAAQQLADEANLFFGPDEQKPGELVSLVRERMAAAQGARPEEAIAEDKAEPPAIPENHESFEAEVTAVENTESTAPPANPFEVDFEPEYESTVEAAPAVNVSGSDAGGPPAVAPEPSPLVGTTTPGRFDGLIVPSVRRAPRQARSQNWGSQSVPPVRPVAPEAPAPELLTKPTSRANPVTLGLPTIEDDLVLETEASTEPAEVPVMIAPPPPDPAMVEQAVAEDAAVLPVEPPFEDAEFAAPTQVSALEPIEWEFEPAAEPEADRFHPEIPMWTVLLGAAAGLLLLRAYFRRRRSTARAVS